MKEEKPEYGWYVGRLIIWFLVFGIIGLGLLLMGLFILGIFGIILIIAGIALLILFMWPGIGLAVINLTIGDEINLDRILNEGFYEPETFAALGDIILKNNVYENSSAMCNFWRLFYENRKSVDIATAYSHYLWVAGQSDKAIEIANEALNLDPNALIVGGKKYYKKK